MTTFRPKRCSRRGVSGRSRLFPRRDVLRALGASAGLLALGCRPERPAVLRERASQALPTIATRSRVAIARANCYDRALIRQQVRALFDGLGGADDLISTGDRVALKVNLTGGTQAGTLPGVSAIESFVTHPEVVRALAEVLREAGARELFIVEAAWQWSSYQAWGYEEVAQALDATLVDLNSPFPYDDFVLAPVGDGWLIYEDVVINQILNEVDVFVSIAKMKCHWSCGVTHSLKNLIGLAPIGHYRLNPGDGMRSDMHGPGDEFGHRLPRVIVDLARARSIDLALIDGIKTTEAGEGPWVPTMAAVEPGLLVASRDPVAADAVATAVMGFDPEATQPTAPFLRSDNHLNLARELGLGTNRLEEIQIAGPSVQDVLYEFRPCTDVSSGTYSGLCSGGGGATAAANVDSDESLPQWLDGHSAGPA